MPLSSQEKAQLQELMRRIQFDDDESVESFALVGGMSDASKRRLDDSPVGESTKKGYVAFAPENQVVGTTPQGKDIVLPPGVESVAAWGQTIINFGKFAPSTTGKEMSYAELFESKDEEHRGYVKYAKGRVHCAKGHLKDLADYVVVRSADPSSQSDQLPFIPGTTEVRRFK